VLVTREVDGGLETVKLALPAIVTTDLRLNEPRFSSLPNIMKARSKPVANRTPEDFGVDVAPRLTVLRVTEPAPRARREGGRCRCTGGQTQGTGSSMMGQILVWAEHDHAALKEATLHAVTAAAQLGEVHLLVAGSGVEAVAQAAAQVAGWPRCWWPMMPPMPMGWPKMSRRWLSD
jgi:electron transfer flavoprotein alpha/beta subunit